MIHPHQTFRPSSLMSTLGSAKSNGYSLVFVLFCLFPYKTTFMDWANEFLYSHSTRHRKMSTMESFNRDDNRLNAIIQYYWRQIFHFFCEYAKSWTNTSTCQYTTAYTPKKSRDWTNDYCCFHDAFRSAFDAAEFFIEYAISTDCRATISKIKSI